MEFFYKKELPKDIPIKLEHIARFIWRQTRLWELFKDIKLSKET
jgi:hypothetical protein